MEDTNNQRLTFEQEGDTSQEAQEAQGVETPETPELSFEQAMQTLEETVRRLESGDLPLSEAIERYKSAMTLVQYCRTQLDKAELEIEQLMTKPDDTSVSQEGDN